MSFKVRKLEKGDIEQIIPLRLALQKYDGLNHGNFEVDEEILGEATRKFLIEKMNEEIFMFGGFVDHELVSICGFNIIQELPNMENLTGKIAFICSVFTKEEFRGNGYQKRTFELCMKYAKSLGMLRFELGTVNPKAIAMYQQFGFAPNKNAMKLKIKREEKYAGK